ncbi:2-C-methyl-D-erythritol 4-phosphate cytidylyltransferase [Gordonia araii NBRC 100433]|uniref:2-C-methyl-D-erythritol 4-phosphate cytidylyltransferase n=1 Tax=Gordonia araii NBRC 100433 TaxID=1073574 RepID=G7H1H6_9ACTN|nr:2-C-methyl-D-erythritol 4-phosphate cytidylyltransferase [Gordonia araii]NNG97790.1 2-C-methyl-D-erythritol 4-phosphate cytidylyltransferase [Gordonia araii NBRC 100433]GAB09701.1 2-C-methyl-D-erythritol 4-phosphate cytidylyltransferase [Gordonia araii NBRC 100433]
MSTSVIIPAAGSGVRLGEDRPKAFVDLGGATILARTVSSVLAADGLDLDRIVVVVPGELIDAVRSDLAGIDSATIVVTAGGDERTDSVRAGLNHVAGDFVLVHDAARPFTPAAVFHRVVEALRAGFPAVVPGLPVVDTLKRVDDDTVIETVDRAVLRAVQTPQGFHADALAKAYLAADGGVATDDAGLAERAGFGVHVVAGDPDAFKITTPWDLRLARAIAKGWD